MIRKKINKIIQLTKVMVKNSFQNLNIIDEKNKKINKKSPYVWMIGVLLIVLIIFSYYVINLLVRAEREIIFLNIFFLISTFLLIFQTILLCTNIFYFSKDVEFLLPHPIKPIELLIAKFNNLMIMIYSVEILFMVIPLLIYGLLISANIVYYLYAILILIIFPIPIVAFISIIMMLLMWLMKIIRNKDVFQTVITFAMIAVVLLIFSNTLTELMNMPQNYENMNDEQLIQFVDEKISKVNKNFIVVEPSVNMLYNFRDWHVLADLGKLIITSAITFLVFLGIGKVKYLKDILASMKYFNVKISKDIDLEKKCKKRRIGKSYVLKEFKNLFKTPAFFIQCVYPIFIIAISIIVILIAIVPSLYSAMQDETLAPYFEDLKFDISAICLILGIIQIICTMSNISITAISRDGKMARLIKYIPVSLYKQFCYKSLPQIIICGIVSVIMVIFILNLIEGLTIWHYISIILAALIMNIINSNLMVLIDLYLPKINWDTEYAVTKQNNKKILQYFVTVLMIVLLYYIAKVFEDIDLNIALIGLPIIFFVISIIIDRIVKIKQDKLFKKII